MNIELLRKVEQAITEEPKRLKMGIWAQRFNKAAISPDDELPPCGTVGCIAGWAVMINQKERHGEDLQAACLDLGVGYAEINFEERGMEALDVHGEMALRLFYVDYWPKDLRSAYFRQDHIGSAGGMARITVQRIERFIESKGEQ